LLGVVLHNTGHRYLVWSRDSAAATHRHPLALDGAMVLATASQVAAVANDGQMDTVSALKTIANAAKVPSMREALEQLEPFLVRGSTPREVAKHFGWTTGISKHALPMATMSVYCFLRYPAHFEHAVKSALLLGGSTDTLAALVGGLVGAHIGADAVPERLVYGITEWPHDREWIKRLAMRLASWPHGEDDLMFAPSLPSYPLAQLMRNGFRKPLFIARWIMLLPWRVLG
jgi:ADP-ribosylglycohydrolase